MEQPIIPVVRIRLGGAASDYPQRVRVSVEGEAICDLEIEISPGLMPVVLVGSADDSDDPGAPCGGAKSGIADRDGMYKQ